MFYCAFVFFLKKYDLIIDSLPCVTIWQESCRKMFSLDALLLDAFGEPVDKELEVCSRIHYFKCFQLQLSAKPYLILFDFMCMKYIWCSH